MGIAYLNRFDYPAAKTELERALQLNPSLPTAHSAVRPRAARARRPRGRRSARSGRSCELNINDFEANLMLGSMRKNAQRVRRRARPISSARWRFAPSDLTARKLLASLRLQTGADRGGGRACSKRSSKEAPDAVDAHVQLATAYNRLKRKDDAERERAIVDRLNAEAQAKQPAPSSRTRAGEHRRARKAHLSDRACGWPAIARRRCALRACSAQSPAAQSRGAGAPPASEAAANGAADPPSSSKLLKAATEARQAERWDEAIALYAKAVKLRPDYVEGYWYQGTAYYTLDNFPQCRDAFRRSSRLAPKNGAALRLPRAVRVRPEGLRPLAAAPAAVARSSASAT